jgi:polyisoprenoid-binding protein YceI
MTKTGPNTYSVAGIFTIRGVPKPETLTFVDDPEGKGVGEIKGKIAFDRKQFGMDSGIPFIRIADRVEVTVSTSKPSGSAAPTLVQVTTGRIRS